MIKKLKFGIGNKKLAKNIATFSIPAGHTCPFAKDCLSFANRITGKLTDGKDCKFRCYAASQECIYSSLRKAVWFNYELLSTKNDIKTAGKLIQNSLPKGVNIIRIHVSGDFYTEKYFLAWLNVALNNPFIIFYGYTKAIPFLVKYKQYFPSNFRITASKGGTHDHLIEKHKLNYAEVVYSLEEAQEKSLDINYDDVLAINGTKSFAVLIHGSQPSGSFASKSLQKLKRQKIKANISKNVDPFITYVTINKLNRIHLPYNKTHINKSKQNIINI